MDILPPSSYFLYPSLSSCRALLSFVVGIFSAFVWLFVQVLKSRRLDNCFSWAWIDVRAFVGMFRLSRDKGQLFVKHVLLAIRLYSGIHKIMLDSLCCVRRLGRYSHFLFRFLSVFLSPPPLSLPLSVSLSLIPSLSPLSLSS